MMVDIHSHILPGVDDGAESWDIAVAMVRIAYADGIRHMVATPHADDQYTFNRALCSELLATLKDRCGVDMEFSLGCDFHFSIENIESALSDPAPYCIGGTNYLLVEFSDFAISPFAGDTLLRFLRMGVTPIITHPERNLILQRQPENILGFAEHGCLLQLTANSITGFWGERARKLCEWLLDRDCVHLVASDAHDLIHRPPVLSTARDLIQRRCGRDLAYALCTTNPAAVVANQAVPFTRSAPFPT